MRVLVCGGRDYGEMPTAHWRLPRDAMDAEHNRCVAQYRLLVDTLDRLHDERRITEIIHGGATGADRMARNWAVRKSVLTHEFKAEWKTHGKAAGPIRNQRMIDEGEPELVVAFPGSKGTADMVRRARAAGIRVVEITNPLSEEPAHV